MKPDRSETGFTVTEALAALLVLGLAMLQVSELMAQVAGTSARSKDASDRTADLLVQYRTATMSASGPGNAGEANGVLALDGETYQLGEQGAGEQAACLFDATGRRCR